jgi:hypothetical protein
MSDPMMAAATVTSAPAGGSPAPAQDHAQASAPAPAQADTTQVAPQGESTQAPAKPAWMAQLPKDLMDDPELSQHDKLDKLARSWKEQGGKLKELDERLKKTSAVPAKDAPPEEWNKFWQQLGRPDDPKGYALNRDGEFADLPKLEGLDEFTADLYHRLNLPKGVAETLWQENAKKTLELMNEIKAQREAEAKAGLKDLEVMWGREAPAKRAELERVATQFFGEEDWKVFVQTPLANNAKFIDKLAKLQRAMSDSRIVSGGGASGSPEPQTVRESLAGALGLKR